MMKKFLYLTLCVALLAACNKDEVEKNVAQDFDTSFAQLLQERGYITDANHFTAAEVADIDYLDVSGTPEDYTAGKGLTSLQGIEWFTSLRILFCDYNQLTNLDVSNNTELTDLDCSSNQLTNLDVSNNTELTDLDCSSNQLTNLDVSNNTKLTVLNCEYNQLTKLDVSKNTELTDLRCFSNQLTNLDVSKNTELTGMSCDYNQLTKLDVSNNTELTGMSCGDNQLTNLDVSNNTKLTFLRCSYNPGNQESTFPVTAWFSENNIPEELDYAKTWYYNEKKISVVFRKSE